ncbi:hypothetical protein K470DRAFT_247056 [Piedraia hortae CBS 480.64]|uniref:NADH dehydrogenase [ubiquinone] iron-sulfur protein 5 n=1 Tax=Piedraia hortae CBS 480.64 TaxID=1314780 RepID=A0A6A7C006_9PEZI|nr:hypothetical protein K470DRAFT_247056 [Piedraia hortae CBS 480.64]
MSSGYGLNGGPSRCIPFWQEFLACYMVSNNEVDKSGRPICGPAMEDYFECLHHKKEAIKTMALQNELRKRELASLKDRPTQSQLVEQYKTLLADIEKHKEGMDRRAPLPSLQTRKQAKELLEGITKDNRQPAAVKG